MTFFQVIMPLNGIAVKTTTRKQIYQMENQIQLNCHIYAYSNGDEDDDDVIVY